MHVLTDSLAAFRRSWMPKNAPDRDTGRSDNFAASHLGGGRVDVLLRRVRWLII